MEFFQRLLKNYQQADKRLGGWLPGGGELGSNLIELGLKIGILNPNSGYDIRIPYSK